MDTNNKGVKTGIFLFVGLIAFTLVIFVIGGNQSMFDSTYILKSKFKDVKGLRPGSVVQLMGIPVGNITRIDFDDQSEKLILSMEILKEFQHRIQDTSRAGVRTQGALGDKYIYISQGTDAGSALLDGEFIQPEEGGDLFSTITERADELSRVFDILQQVNKMLYDINGNGELKEIMSNLKLASYSLKSSVDSTDSLMKKINQSEIDDSLLRVNSILSKIDKGTGTLGALINDPSLHYELKRLLGNSGNNNQIKGLIRESIQTTEK